MTLTDKLDLNIHPLDLHDKLQVCMSVPLVKRKRRTHTDDVKTSITPTTSEAWGVVITDRVPIRLSQGMNAGNQ